MRSSPKPISAKPRRHPAGHLPPKPYHHGDLRRVLIDAALGLAEEGGAEAVSVREAARRAGVSPGAPFRHFETRDALMTAVAEEAQRRFRAEIQTALAEATAGGLLSRDPLRRFRKLGLARMNLDGHFPRWGVADNDVERTAEAVLDLFIGGIARPLRG